MHFFEAGQHTGRADEQDTLRDAGADGREALGTLQELHNLHAYTILHDSAR